ncbi:hypothetical protein L7D48_10465 [Streptomyces sp. S1A]|uniref:hypothetical protein n=1 Tax=Streptomyces sp. ICN903 TaxID=2964654 RepID=UPI001EDACEA5|nr:hypothetical protein [Streptomyces sp. ICN903]MCG3040980.1 hypothetical protein [Streptomyces sp. ICN903]
MVELTRFATLPNPRAALGVVSGQRRRGETFLPDAVTRASGGFMFTATETTEAEDDPTVQLIDPVRLCHGD